MIKFIFNENGHSKVHNYSNSNMNFLYDHEWILE